MPRQRPVSLQPKQTHILKLLTEGRSSWIGMGGGRGCGKSDGIDRISLWLAAKYPGCLIAIVMRTFRQVREFHIDPMRRNYPELDPYYSATTYKYRIPNPGQASSEIVFMYADSYRDVENNFRSGNFKFIIIDQSEQFMKEELIEIKKACRADDGAKMLLSHNMGGVGIQFHRQIFKDFEYNERQDPRDYAHVHVFPWDNVHWVRSELAKDGLSEGDYYAWSDTARMEYAATRGEYTRSLNSDDDAIRARDWLGSWESLEGAFFGRVFDRASVLISPAEISRIVKPWHTRWLSTDWGKAHYCSTHWHTKVTLTPTQCKESLGWEVGRPVNAVITYRELIVSELESSAVGKRIVEETPSPEREALRQYFLSPDAFGERDSDNTIALKIGKELKPYGMPQPVPADTDRKGGAALMTALLAETKRHASSTTDEDIWLISSECPELLNTIPMLMRDPRDIDDVLKTDKGMAKLEQDVYDDVRYGLKSMLRPNMKVPLPVQAAEIKARITDPHARSMAMREFEHKAKQNRSQGGRWRRY